jgi:hypothetical protein
MPKKTVLGLMLATVLVAGCAGARGGATGGSYSEEVGPATMPAVEREALPILERFGYTIQRTDRVPDRITIETAWVNREPFADEAAAGAADVRTRVVITTRPRSTTNSGGATVSGVTLRVEVEHMGQAANAWAPAPVRSSEMAAVVRRLVEAFRLEFQVKGIQG